MDHVLPILRNSFHSAWERIIDLVLFYNRFLSLELITRIYHFELEIP